MARELTSVCLVLREGGDALEQLAPFVSLFLGPSPTLSLTAACRLGSLRLLDWIWHCSCTSRADRPVGWSLNNYLRSELQYNLWQFRRCAVVAAERGDLPLLQWLFAHFQRCYAPVDVVEAAAKNGHLHILAFLLENDAGRAYPHSHTPIVVNSGIVPYESKPQIPRKQRDQGIVVHWGGRSMLHAIEQKHVHIARWLCQNSPHEMDADEIRWAIEYSLRVPDMELARFFLPTGRSIVEFAHDDLHPEVIEKLLDDGYIRQDEQCAAVSVNMLATLGRLDLMKRIMLQHSPPRATPRFNWSSEWFFATKEACKFGDVRVVRWLMEHPIGRSTAEAYQHHHSAGPEHLFCLAAAGGHLEVMRYLHEQGYSDNFDEAGRLAARNGHADALNWLLQNYSYWSYEFAVREAAKYGRVNVLRFLLKADFEKHKDIFQSAMDRAAANGHLEAVQWLHENRPGECTTKAMDNAAGNGHLEMVKWLHANRSEGCSIKAMIKAAANGHLEVLQWLHDNHFEGRTTMTMDLAAANGHLHVVKWLHANRTEGCTSKAFEMAIQNSHIRVAWWLHGHYPRWVPSGNTLKIQNPNQFDVLLLLNRYYPRIFRSDTKEPRMALITEPGDDHALKWLGESYSLREDYRIRQR